MQIAMHESIIPLERQYEICRIARELMSGDDTVSRIIMPSVLQAESGRLFRTEIEGFLSGSAWIYSARYVK